MESKYAEWIKEYVERSQGRLRGSCGSAAEEMSVRFPELHMVRGFVVPADPTRTDYSDELPTVEMELESRRLAWDNECGVTQHFWCEDTDGTKYDPTVGQFREGIALVYIEYDPLKHGPTPLGKCPDCGELVFPPSDGFCDATCRTLFTKYMDGINV